jgi:hypothetical protein
MAETKSGIKITSDVIKYSPHPQIPAPGFTVWGREIGGPNWSIGIEPITEPVLMVPETYVHDFDDFLGFFGGNPLDIREFEAEVWIFLGAEREKHVITSPTFIYIPGGVLHCPLWFKRIDKPIVFMHSFAAPAYVRQVIPSELSELAPGEQIPPMSELG